MYIFGIFAFAALAAATVVTIGDIGDPFAVYHQSGDTMWLRHGAGILRICLVMTQSNPCVVQFEHSLRCPAITSSCKCYAWASTASNEQCLDVPYIDNTTAVSATWQLMRVHNIKAAPSRLALWYAVLATRFPVLSFAEYLDVACHLTAEQVAPAPCAISHTIPIRRVSAQEKIPSTSSFDGPAWAIAIVVVGIPLVFTYIRFEDAIRK
jgi:hypothetical protein